MHILAYTKTQQIFHSLYDSPQLNILHNISIHMKAGTALRELFTKEYDAVITEPPAPGDQVNFLRCVRLQKSATKIIIVVPDHSASGNVDSLLGNVDACLPFPFRDHVLITILKRFDKKEKPAKEEPLVIGELTIFPDSHEVNRAGRQIPLRKKEYQLLEFLLKNKNRVVNKHTILEYLWSYDTSTMTNTLDVHMSNLRKKIDGDTATKIIRTVYGAGYKLCI